jgi:hypothetical protein
MPKTALEAGLDGLNPHEIALALASFTRILLDELYANDSLDRAKVERQFRAEAGELIALQMQQNAANLLRLMSHTVSPQKADK